MSASKVCPLPSSPLGESTQPQRQSVPFTLCLWLQEWSWTLVKCGPAHPTPPTPFCPESPSFRKLFQPPWGNKDHLRARTQTPSHTLLRGHQTRDPLQVCKMRNLVIGSQSPAPGSATQNHLGICGKMQILRLPKTR